MYSPFGGIVEDKDGTCHDNATALGTDETRTRIHVLTVIYPRRTDEETVAEVVRTIRGRSGRLVVRRKRETELPPLTAAIRPVTPCPGGRGPERHQWLIG